MRFGISVGFFCSAILLFHIEKKTINVSNLASNGDSLVRRCVIFAVYRDLYGYRYAARLDCCDGKLITGYLDGRNTRI